MYVGQGGEWRSRYYLKQVENHRCTIWKRIKTHAIFTSLLVFLLSERRVMGEWGEQNKRTAKNDWAPSRIFPFVETQRGLN
jgi:hypothetical protein